MEDDGGIVVPATMRARHSWTEGSLLVAVDTDLGVFLADQTGLEHVVRARLAGHDLLDCLLSTRRREASYDSRA